MQRTEMTRIRITDEFATNPNGREDGVKFREVIEPALKKALTNGRDVTVDLNGFEYGTAFLEEAFGGLTRGQDGATAEEILNKLTIEHELRPYVLAAEGYIRNPDRVDPSTDT